MKAILEFNLPEEKEEFTLAREGVDYMLALSDVDNYLRNKIKYDESLGPEDEALYQEIRDKLHEFANDRGVEV